VVEAKKNPPQQPAQAFVIDLKIPVAEERETEVHEFGHVEVRMGPRERKAFRRMYDGLHGKHATYRYGHQLSSQGHVDRPTDVMHWILQGIADAIDAAEALRELEQEYRPIVEGEGIQPPVLASPPVKRGPGRPKGSKGRK
jgi:hypothetical protein